MTSLPGDSASSARLVTRPYPTAASAQTSATTTPWSDRKSDKGNGLQKSCCAKGAATASTTASGPRPLSNARAV